MMMKSRVFNISIYNRNVPILVEMMGHSPSDDAAFLIYGIFPVFQPFQPLLSSKWLIFRVMMKSRVFNISIYNRNVPILVEMMGQSPSDDVAFLKYGIFPDFQPSQPLFLLKMADFQGDNEVQSFQYFNLQQKCTDSG